MDTKLKDVYFYPESSDLFSNAAIADGISIVVKKEKKVSGGFSYYYCSDGNEKKVDLENPGENIIPLNPSDIIIVKKIESFVEKYHLKYLHDRVHPQKLFAIESDFVSKNLSSVREYSPGMSFNKHNEIKLHNINNGLNSGSL